MSTFPAPMQESINVKDGIRLNVTSPIWIRWFSKVADRIAGLFEDTNISTTGTLSAGAISGSSVAATGAVSGASGAFSGVVTGQFRVTDSSDGKTYKIISVNGVLMTEEI